VGAGAPIATAGICNVRADMAHLLPGNFTHRYERTDLPRLWLVLRLAPCAGEREKGMIAVSFRE
jgi:hypothetical protein